MLWADANVHRDIGDEKRYVLEVWVLAQVAFNWKIAQSNFPLQDGGDPGLASPYLPLLKPIQH
jgi:hypothetical protein